MKNRRSVVIAFLMAVVLCLGIGYASVSDTLDVVGFVNLDTTAATADFNADIYWTNATAVASNTSGTNSPSVIVLNANNGDANDKLDITVPANVLINTDDTVTVTATIKNDSTEFAATITPSAVLYANNTGAYEVTFGESSYTVAANSSVAVEIIITLKDEVSEAVTSNKFDITFTAVSVTP